VVVLLLASLLACSGSDAGSATEGSPGSAPAARVEAFRAVTQRLPWTRHTVPMPESFDLTEDLRKQLAAIDAKAAAAFLPAATAYTEAVLAADVAIRAGRAPSDEEVAAVVTGWGAIRAVALDATVEAADAIGAEGRKALGGTGGGLGTVLARGPLDHFTTGMARLQAPPGSAQTSAALQEVLDEDDRRAAQFALRLLAWRTASEGIDADDTDVADALRKAVETFAVAADEDLAARLRLAGRYIAALPAADRAALGSSRAFRAWAGVLPPAEGLSFAFGLDAPGSAGVMGAVGAGGGAAPGAGAGPGSPPSAGMGGGPGMAPGAGMGGGPGMAPGAGMGGGPGAPPAGGSGAGPGAPPPGGGAVGGAPPSAQ
jgi:hypothetical protein